MVGEGRSLLDGMLGQVIILDTFNQRGRNFNSNH